METIITSWHLYSHDCWPPVFFMASVSRRLTWVYCVVASDSKKGKGKLFVNLKFKSQTGIVCPYWFYWLKQIQNNPKFKEVEIRLPCKGEMVLACKEGRNWYYPTLEWPQGVETVGNSMCPLVTLDTKLPHLYSQQASLYSYHWRNRQHLPSQCPGM